MEYQIAKGVFDILPKDPEPEGKWRESHLWQYIENCVREISNEYGFREMRTPIFEKTELFQRSIGSTSDIVSKEMYTFLDKGNRSLTLRPEGTAAAIRAFIEKRLDQQLGLQKFFYILPMFRYERQQAGRYRQHHQFGVEALGNASPFQDVEVIHLLFSFFQRLGLKGLTLHLNSIGDLTTRQKYKEALKDFLLPHYNELSSDSQERFHSNILRILDSKDPKDKKALHDVPSIIDFLTGEVKDHFEAVCSLLQENGISYQLNPKLVRGLDYYNKTVFEITAGELGSQNSIGGGGRYDDLVKQLGGPDTPAFGFGAGIERIIQTMLAQQVPLPSPFHPLLYLIPIGKNASKECFKILCALRAERLAIEMDFSEKKLKNALRYADALQAKYVVVIGDDEMASGMIELKEMQTGKGEKIALNFLSKRLKNG